MIRIPFSFRAFLKNARLLLILVGVVFVIGSHVVAQTILWQEDFSGSNAGWTQNFTDCDGTPQGFAGVRNDRFEVVDMEGTPCCTLQGNPGVTATLTTAPFTHNETASFTCPQAGTYTVVATDAGGCSGTGSITITAAQGCSVPAPNMVTVEGGTFVMGCTAEQEPDCNTNEYPAHEVTLSDFDMGKYEVTQGEWMALMGSNPSAFATCGMNCPVEQVSWFDAAVYCNRLSECLGFTPCYYADAAFTQIYGKNGTTWSLPNSGTVYWKQNANGYRLPTEAEWEYAARGGEKSKGYKYAGSNDINVVAWYVFNSAGIPHDVGIKMSNALGFYDLSGNIMEWCYDWLSASYYASSPSCSPVGPNAASFPPYKVKRGGAWDFSNTHAQASYRSTADTPDIRGYSTGFRLARTPIPSPPPCVTTLTHPTNGAISVALTTAIEWAKVPTATGYRLNLGTAPGGTQLLNNQDMGDTTRYNPVGCLPQNTTIHVSLTPYNADGSAMGCTGFSFTTGSGVPEMVLVPGGTIKLGGQPPSTLVTIDSFLIGRYEVTQCEWVSLMGSNPSNYTGCGVDCPVEQVSWYDAAVYCNRLSVQQGFAPCYYSDAAFTQTFGRDGSTWSLPNTGAVYWLQNAKGYRLHTEAEWEFAARGANNTPDYVYSGSDNEDQVSWNSGSIPPFTHPVGLKLSNELGLYDMTGNLNEWCWDWWGGTFPNGGNNPLGPLGGASRLMRGGSWGDNAPFLRVSTRRTVMPTNRQINLGFRLARKP